MVGDRVVRMETRVLAGLLMCHCFIWFEELGGDIIVELYVRWK